ncbi:MULTISPECIES: nuclear transport factor 2 family protein [Staphylococcus]|uniref:nuclear transport factor 2 family protein n=1 Tax=Staphylococcus TaxID=1279 RepID=UPI002040A618|nr:MULTISPECIES: nuclear transport factor 2 family protein [Staphylococcus]MCM3295588.1 nuclear transport factor 2 family protein [Staphylococcus capitis]MDS3993569.1 nuclear transport factor 2 family protein [Staphylococcus capitis]
MLFERNKPYTQETLLDKENILELIQFERFCRDNALWDSMRTCFAKDSHVSISWFNGTGEEFVSSSEAMNRYAPHQIYNTQMWINNHRAVAIMQATIQFRVDIKNVEMQLDSDTKIIYCLEKDNDDVWYISNLSCIYEKDKLTPVIPTTINLPNSEFSEYRESYACLSYALNELGYDVNHDLPGIDRPDEVNKYYRQLDKWLTEKDDEEEEH